MALLVVLDVFECLESGDVGSDVEDVFLLYVVSCWSVSAAMWGCNTIARLLGYGLIVKVIGCT